jgi:hypothetical protein
MAIDDVEKAVEDAGISQVYFGRFDLAFPDVFMPWLKLIHHEGSGQNIKGWTHGFVRQAHGPGKLGGVPELSVIMRQHRPESAHGSCREGDPQLGNISLKEGFYEAFSSGMAVIIRIGKKGTGETAAKPKGLPGIRTRFTDIKTR